MTITTDPDVAEAATLLQGKFEAGKLSAIAQSLADLAPALWGRYPKIEIAPTVLTSESPSPEASSQ